VDTLIKIAFKNLNRQKKRSFLLGGAIAFGIMIVTVINGFAGAFVGNLAGNMADLFAGHVFVEGVEKTASKKNLEIIRDDTALNAALAASGIDSRLVQKRSAADTTIVFEGKKTTQAVMGADFAGETYLRKRLVLKEGKYEDLFQPKSLVLSEKVAKKIKAQVGDKILVQLKTVAGQNNVGELTLRGLTFDMGIFSNMIAYASRDYLNELMALGPNEYQLYGIMLDDLSKSEAAKDALTAALKTRAQVFELPPDKAAASTSSGAASMMQSRYGELQKLAKKETWTGTKYRVFTINDMISQVEQVSSVINTASVVILAVLFLIIMVGISNTFRMVMYERIREIGTMRSLGMQRPSVRRLFLYEAGFLATGGTLAGLALAGIIMAVLSLFNFGTASFFSLLMRNGHLTFTVGVGQAILNFAVVLVLTMVAAFLPARKASRLEPAVALRTSK
jgi:putative ABC transport system permease protein